MTEADWGICLDPERMLDHLQSRVSDRKLRLFAVACARRAWRLFTEWTFSENILLAEHFADGEVSADRVKVVRSQLGARGGFSARWAASNLVSAVLHESANHAARNASHYAAELVHYLILEMSSSHFERFKPAADAARSAERQEQADLLRDMIGNPFRPIRLEQSWRAPQVIRLAGEMYERREFKPWVLADALEASGCTEAAVISRCHELGEHFRGWWIVDSLLAKA